MKNILFVSPNVYPVLDNSVKNTQVVFGGAEVQINLLARALQSMGHQVSCMVTKNTDTQKQAIEGISIISFKGTIQFILKTIQSNASYVVFRSRGKKQWMLALLCAISRKKNEYQSTGYQHVWAKKNTLALANSIKVDTYDTTVKNNDVLWVGRSDVWKQPEVVVDLATKLREVSFTVVLTKGNDQAYHEKIEAQFRALKNVTLHEYVPLGEIQDMYDAHKIYINTSVAEGYPNSFLQSAIGSCSIVSLSADPNGMLSISKVGILASKENIYSHIESLLHDEKMRKEYCVRAYGYVSQNNNIDINGKLFVEALV